MLHNLMAQFDLIIVGGGMAGLSLIASLAPSIKLGLKVALIDPAERPSDHQISSPSFDDRATALSAQALTSLQELGIDKLEQWASPIQQIEVSDKGHAGYHLMNAQQQGHEHFGAVIANRTLGHLLWQRCQHQHDQQRQHSVNWFFETSVKAIKPNKNGQTLVLEDATTLSGKLVILCDGGRSKLNEQLGITATAKPFNAIARVASVTTQKPHNGTAFERFTEDGPIALLPFGEFSTLVWTVPDAKKADYPNTADEALTMLNATFRQRLGQITGISDWFEYPLIERRISQNVGHGFLALGNAAATLHPVAGQGFNLALRGIARTAFCINQCFFTHQTLPTFNQLCELNETLSKDQNQTGHFSRELVRLFGSSSPVAQIARGIGLNSLDRHPLFSQSFALTTMGLLESTPSLTKRSSTA